MAEVVRQTLERMVPELEDYREKKLFNESELRSIVKKRTDFEYQMMRKVPIKMDFLRAIEYELNLEELRKNRKERFGPFKKNSVSDFAITRRVHYVFERALRKFGDDLALWSQLINFCVRTEAKRSLAKIFPRALQLHPLHVPFWEQAAIWEYEGQHNIAAARALFQRGLRINPGARALWHAFFGVEVGYVLKVTERKRVLGLLDAAPKEEGDVEDAAEAEALRARERALLAGVLPRAIFDNAMRSDKVGVDYEFCAAFLQYVPPSAERLAGLRQHVLATAAGRFGGRPEAVDLVAKHRLSETLAAAAARPAEERPSVDGLEEPALAAFELALGQDPSRGEVWVLFATHVLERSLHYERLHARLRREATLFKADGDRKRRAAPGDVPASPEAKLAAAAAGSLLRRAGDVCRRGAEALAAGDAPWVRLQELLVRSLLRAGDREAAREAARATTAAHAASVTLWRARLAVERELALEGHEEAAASASRKRRRRGKAGDAADPSGGLAALLAAHEEAVAAVPRADALPLWLDYLELHAALAEEAAKGHAASADAEEDGGESSSSSSSSSSDSDDAAAESPAERARASRSRAARAAFRKAVAARCDDPEGRLKVAYVRWAASAVGPAETAEAVRYVRRTAMPNAMPVYEACAEALVSAAGGSKARAAKQVRAVFETAVGEHGSSSVDLWMTMARFESDVGGKAASGRVAQVHWRAKRTLADGPREEFLARYQREVVLGQ